jgi:hypothetical protein
MPKMKNPTAPGRASMGSEIHSWGADGSDSTTTAQAIKKILARVSVSEHVALVIAAHAGLLQEGR